MNIAVENTANNRDIYNVTRLNREVRAVLEGSFPMLWVQGEISNFAQPASGHMYFSLKDASSQVRCAMFKGRNRNLKFSPENGLEVVARASVSLYEGRGEFQLIIEQLELAGEGALQRAFEELKQRLNKEGLFDEAIKKPVPDFPHAIGVITSATGAAIRDILNVLQRRYPIANVIVYPVPVQGEGAAIQIAEMIKLADKRNEVDVLILARGGGSLEDLWAFNEEILARTIFQCKLPIVSGVGHEIDFTICDFVADQRAPTPSAAAELVSPNGAELKDKLTVFENNLHSSIKNTIDRYKHHLQQLDKRLPHPARYLQTINQRVDDLSIRLNQVTKTIISEKRSLIFKHLSQVNQHNPLQLLRFRKGYCESLTNRLHQRIKHLLETSTAELNRLGQALHTVSPLATLDRGYAIVSNKGDEIIRDINRLKINDSIRVRLANGKIQSKVTKIEKTD